MCFGGSKSQPAPQPAPQPVMARAPVEPEVPVGRAPKQVPAEKKVTEPVPLTRTTSKTTGLTIPV